MRGRRVEASAQHSATRRARQRATGRTGSIDAQTKGDGAPVRVKPSTAAISGDVGTEASKPSLVSSWTVMYLTKGLRRRRSTCGVAVGGGRGWYRWRMQDSESS